MRAKRDSVNRLVGHSWSLEWREHGRWVKSAKTFTSPEKAREHSEIIGCAGSMIRIQANVKDEVPK